jgi:hypothetical protein
MVSGQHSKPESQAESILHPAHIFLQVSVNSVLMILAFTSAFILLEQSNLVLGARSLVRIKTSACEAGDPGFKSQRARHNLPNSLRNLNKNISS